MNTQPEPPKPEPWLRGPLPGLHPLLAPLLCSFQQTREDLAYWTHPLTTAELWERPHGAPSVGFHIRHLAGSIDRLLTYALQQPLSEQQLSHLAHESDPGATLPELLAALHHRLDAAEAVVKSLDPARLTEARSVGRQQLPTTLGGLLTHIAEHTQRHLGQAITTARIVSARPAK